MHVSAIIKTLTLTLTLCWRQLPHIEVIEDRSGHTLSHQSQLSIFAFSEQNEARYFERYRHVVNHYSLGWVLYYMSLGRVFVPRWDWDSAGRLQYKTASFIHKSHARPRVRTAQVSLILQAAAAAAAAAAGAVSITGAPSYPTTISHRILLRIFINLSLPCRRVIQFCGRQLLTVCTKHQTTVWRASLDSESLLPRRGINCHATSAMSTTVTLLTEKLFLFIKFYFC